VHGKEKDRWPRFVQSAPMRSKCPEGRYYFALELA
jgi:hypothetical protein